ncbi:MAG: hypothetical protein IKK74_01060 [Clostridia bacterium]|nr:hypothetical protein [Clostridia bacterium]
MTTDITFGDYHKVFVAPDDVHYVGVSVKYNGNNFSLITGIERTGAVRKDEVIILDENIKVILHNYSSPELSELVKELDSFKGMKLSDVRTGKLRLFQTL